MTSTSAMTKDVDKMKNWSKISKFGVGLSAFAMILSAISLVGSVMDGRILGYGIVNFACMVVVFASNLLVAVSNAKKKTRE